MLQKRFLAVLLILLLVPFASSALAQEDAEDNPLKIGLMVDQSGALTVYGYELEYGFKLGLLYQAGINPSDYESVDAALEDVRIAGRPVEVLVRDNSSQPDTASSQARELIEVEGVELLVGAPSSGVTVGLQQVAQDYNTILFAAPGASPSITGANFNPNTFRVCRNSYHDAAALGPLTERVGSDWAILAADYEFGRASAQVFQQRLPEYGVNFVKEPIFGPLDTTDFTPYLQEATEANPDALLTVWAGDNSLALYQQIDELGVDDDVAIVGGTNSNDISAVALSEEQIGQYGFIVYHYSLPDNEVNDWLVEKHVEFFPNPSSGETDYPDLFTGCSFATAQALMKGVEASTDAALEADASVVDGTLPEYMIPALEGMSVDSPKGTIYIRPSDHQALVPMYLIQIDNVDDPEYKFYDLIDTVGPLESAPPCDLTGEYEERCQMNEAFMEELSSMMEGDMEGEGESAEPATTEEAEGGE